MDNEKEILSTWERAEGLTRFILWDDYREKRRDVIEEAVAECKVAFFEYAAKGGDLAEAAVGAVIRARLRSRRESAPVRLTEGDDKVLKQALAIIYKAERLGKPHPSMQELRDNVYKRCFQEVADRGVVGEDVIREKLSRRGVLAALDWLPELLGVRYGVALDAPETRDMAAVAPTNQDLGQGLESVIEMLPPNEREAVALVMDSGLTRAEIAEKTGVDSRAVSKILADMKKFLQSPAGSFALFAPGIESLVVEAPSAELDYLAHRARKTSRVKCEGVKNA